MLFRDYSDGDRELGVMVGHKEPKNRKDLAGFGFDFFRALSFFSANLHAHFAARLNGHAFSHSPVASHSHHQFSWKELSPGKLILPQRRGVEKLTIRDNS